MTGGDKRANLDKYSSSQTPLKYKSSVNVIRSDKHSSLPQQISHVGLKKFYSIGPKEAI